MPVSDPILRGKAEEFARQLGHNKTYEEDENIPVSVAEWCRFNDRVSFEATCNDYVDVDCHVTVAECPTDDEIIQTIKRGTDIDCKTLKEDIGKDDSNENLPSVGVKNAISALETVK
jgi:hypothetical protein